MIQLSLSKFPTANILFPIIPIMLTTSDAHKFFSMNFADAQNFLETYLPDPDKLPPSQTYAIVPYSHQYADIPLMTPSLSPQYLHPPNEIISPVCNTITNTLRPSPLQKLSTTSNAPANFDRDNPAV